MLEFSYTGSGLAVHVPFELDAQVREADLFSNATRDLKNWNNLEVDNKPEQTVYDFNYAAMGKRTDGRRDSALDHMAHIVAELAWACDREKAAPELFLRLQHHQDTDSDSTVKKEIPRLMGVSIQPPDHEPSIIKKVALQAMQTSITQLNTKHPKLLRDRAEVRLSDDNGLVLRVDRRNSKGRLKKGNAIFTDPEVSNPHSRLEAYGLVGSTYEQIVCLTGAVAIAELARS
jgi:hypothetical protein